MDQLDPFLGIIAPYTNTAIFLIMAVYFFRKPLMEAATKKRKDFQKLLDESQAAKISAEEKLAELNGRLAGLDQEIAKIKEDAELAARMEAQNIVSDAERLANHLREEAQKVSKAEVDKARKALREEIVSAVTDSVTSKAKSDLDSSSHLQLVNKRIGVLTSLNANA